MSASRGSKKKAGISFGCGYNMQAVRLNERFPLMARVFV
jgi:hypothetical protein